MKATPCCASTTVARLRDAATLAAIYRALADETRLRILALLAPPGDGTLDEAGEVCVCHLHASLKVPQPTVSRHLAYLRKSGLVEARRQGIWMHYRVARPSSPVVRTVLDAALHALGHAERTSRDRQQLGRVLASAPRPAEPMPSAHGDPTAAVHERRAGDTRPSRRSATVGGGGLA